MQSFQGLLENEGRPYSNWGLSRTTKPAVYVEPISYRDLSAFTIRARTLGTNFF